MNIESRIVATGVFESPCETRCFTDRGRVDLVDVAGKMVARVTLEPGWRWSTDIRPYVDTDSCEIWHFGYCLRGRLRYTLNTGERYEIGAGEVFSVPPGHDAETVGGDTCVYVDFGEAADFARTFSSSTF